jgi:hypothetical protein
MNKKASIAALLAVVLVAAVGVFVLAKGVSNTGMMMSVRPLTETPQGAFLGSMCGKACVQDSDCVGQCGTCSRYSGTCTNSQAEQRRIEQDTGAAAAYRGCLRSCADVFRTCDKLSAHEPCRADLLRCEANCKNEIYG